MPTRSSPLPLVTPEAYAKYLPECVDCGACCHTNEQGRPATYVGLDREDFEKIPDEFKDRVVDAGDGSFEIKTTLHGNRPKRCACAMLDQRCHKRCRIYDSRPTICRVFRRGGPECIAQYLAFHGKLGRQL